MGGALPSVARQVYYNLRAGAVGGAILYALHPVSQKFAQRRRLFASLQVQHAPGGFAKGQTKGFG